MNRFKTLGVVSGLALAAAVPANAAVDTTTILAEITDGQTAAVAIVVAMLGALFAIVAVKMIKRAA